MRCDPCQAGDHSSHSPSADVLAVEADKPGGVSPDAYDCKNLVPDGQCMCRHGWPDHLTPSRSSGRPAPSSEGVHPNNSPRPGDPPSPNVVRSFTTGAADDLIHFAEEVNQA